MGDDKCKYCDGECSPCEDLCERCASAFMPPLGTEQEVVIHANPDGKSRSQVTVTVSPDGVYEMTWGWEPVRRVFGVKGGDYMQDYEQWGVYPPQDNASQLGAEQAEVDDDTFKEFSVYDPDPTDDAQREQERIRLVDGYPGEWEWTGERWEMTVYHEHATFVEAAVETSGDGYWSCLRLESPTTGGEVDLIESAAISDNLMEAAAAIRPHAEAIVEVLKGMRDE